MTTGRISPARLAVLMMFFSNGAVLSSWASRIPQIQDKLGLSEGALGIVLLGLAVGVLTALPLAGGLIVRFSSRSVLLFAGIANVLTLPLLALAPEAILLWFALFLFGATTSTMDIAMNAQAVGVEKNVGKPIMSSFHAAFSIGAFVGALMGSGAVAVGFEPLSHFLIASVIFGGIILSFTRQTIDIDGEIEESGGAIFRLPVRALWVLGALGFCATIGEGAMADWSAVYMEDIVGTTEQVAPLGFAAFSLTMTGGRLIGDWLTARFSAVTIVRLGGLLSGSGLLVVVILPETIPALIGFAFVGAGLATIVPIVFSAAGNMPNVPSGAGIAGVATIGYAGFLAGPPVIGLIAEATSLQSSLLLVAAFSYGISFLANAVSHHGRDLEPIEATG